jgi:hypothetical protein
MAMVSIIRVRLDLKFYNAIAFRLVNACWRFFVDKFGTALIEIH